MQITGYQPRSIESETLKVELKNLHHKLSKWFWSISSLTCSVLRYAMLFCIVDSVSMGWLSEVGLLNQRIKMLLKTKEKLHYSQVLKGIRTFSFSIWFHVFTFILSFIRMDFILEYCVRNPLSSFWLFSCSNAFAHILHKGHALNFCCWCSYCKCVLLLHIHIECYVYLWWMVAIC